MVKASQSTSLTAEFILRGFALALEQCGLLLRDANGLYQRRSYGNAIVMAAFAREELGRSELLLDFWRQRRGGSTVTVKQIKAACKKHVEKQRAGMLSTTMMEDRDTPLGKLMRQRMMNARHTQEWKEADTAVELELERIRMRTPDERHTDRMRALYVEPISSSEWNRPADISAQTACRFLQDAVNDYSGRYHQGYITSDPSILKDIDRELHDAL